MSIYMHILYVASTWFHAWKRSGSKGVGGSNKCSWFCINLLTTTTINQTTPPRCSCGSFECNTSFKLSMYQKLIHFVRRRSTWMILTTLRRSSREQVSLLWLCGWSSPTTPRWKTDLQLEVVGWNKGRCLATFGCFIVFAYSQDQSYSYKIKLDVQFYIIYL